MSSDLDIANRALSAIGARSGSTGSVSAISSFNENSREADQVNLLYPGTRDDLLRSAHWDFARVTNQLSLLKSAPGTPENMTTASTWSNQYPPPPWLYEYAYPSDCIKIRSVKSGASALAFGFPQFPPFSQMQRAFAVGVDVPASGNGLVKVVLSNLDQAIATYTCRMTDPSLWDPSFEQAMVVALAARLAMPLAGSPQLKQAMLQEAQAAVMSARVSDGNEGSITTQQDADWIRVRGGLCVEPPDVSIAGWETPSWLGL